jgi:protein-ribulosamine 3-kinase
MMTSGELSTAMGAAMGVKLHPQPAGRAHGGSINECYRWESDVGSLFVKVAAADRRAMLEAEAVGLEELRRAAAVRVPRVLGVGVHESHSWLALEWIQLAARTGAAEAALGEQLAAQHRCTAPAFGWYRNNTIGSTPQVNDWTSDWVAFFRDRRLRYQLDLAGKKGYGAHLMRRGEALLERMGGLFTTYRPTPSLLHGDLWGGNWGVGEGGEPVVFDPAVYYGDREADLAMTRLFGGFGAPFYAAYEAASPLDAGARARADLYNLYHVLNHLNLFGSSYSGQALSLVERLLAELV